MKNDIRMKKTEDFNAKLPDDNPKNGHRSNIIFGDEKPQPSRTERLLSPRVPPGGKSNIIFG